MPKVPGKPPAPWVPRPLSKLEEFKITSYRERFGPMTSADALAASEGDEKIMRDLTAFDPAFEHYAGLREALLNYSVLLDMEERYAAAEKAASEKKEDTA